MDVVKRVYPNPVSDILNLKLKGNGDYHIYNELGKELSSGKVKDGRNEISMKALPSGVYIISVQSNSGNARFKAIKN